MTTRTKMLHTSIGIAFTILSAAYIADRDFGMFFLNLLLANIFLLTGIFSKDRP